MSQDCIVGIFILFWYGIRGNGQKPEGWLCRKSSVSQHTFCQPILRCWYTGVTLLTPSSCNCILPLPLLISQIIISPPLFWGLPLRAAEYMKCYTFLKWRASLNSGQIKSCFQNWFFVSPMPYAASCFIFDASDVQDTEPVQLCYCWPLSWGAHDSKLKVSSPPETEAPHMTQTSHRRWQLLIRHPHTGTPPQWRSVNHWTRCEATHDDGYVDMIISGRQWHVMLQIG